MTLPYPSGKVKTTLTLLWLFAAFAAAVAVLAYSRTRRLARKLRHLSQSYWELKYQYGQLSSRVARLDPQPDGPRQELPPASATALIPLSSLKR